MHSSESPDAGDGVAHAADGGHAGDVGPGASATGRVPAALAQLAALDQTPLAGHPDIYQQVHAELQGALADIDDA